MKTALEKAAKKRFLAKATVLLLAIALAVLLALPLSASGKKKSCKSRCWYQQSRCVTHCRDYSGSWSEAERCATVCRIRYHRCKKSCRK